MIIAALGAMAATAGAQTTALGPAPERSPFSVGLGLGWAKMDMADINGVIDDVNEEFGEDILSQINSGVEFDLVLGYQVTPSINAGAVYTRIDASSIYDDPEGAMEIQVPANFFGIFGQYSATTAGKMGYGLGAEIGLLSTTGEWDLAIPNVIEENGKFEGSTFGGTGYVMIEYAATHAISMQFQGGYRFGTITDLKFAGEPADRNMDYNGGFLRAVFRIHP